MASLKSQYDETISGGLKLAIFIGMLPKEAQDTVLQNGTMMKEEMTYERCRDQIVSIANQKTSMGRPDPSWDGSWADDGRATEPGRA